MDGQTPCPSLSTLGLIGSTAGAESKASKKLGWWGEIWARRSWEAVQLGYKPCAPPLPEKPLEPTLAVSDQLYATPPVSGEGFSIKTSTVYIYK